MRGRRLSLAVGFALAGEAIARAEEPPLTGGPPCPSRWPAPASPCCWRCTWLSAGWTTILLGAALSLPALATRYRTYPVLGWLAPPARLVVLSRFAIDPTIVGATRCRQTPVFNCAAAGLRHAGAGLRLRRLAACPHHRRPAAAGHGGGGGALCVLSAAMLVRHAMNGGVIDADAPTLAEQAIYTLIALGAAARSWSRSTCARRARCLRIGSMAAGVVSAAMIVVQHFLLLNPLFTDESTGRIPFFNLLFLAYLLPALAAGGAGALCARQAAAMVFGDAGAAGLGACLRLCDAVGAAAVPGRAHRRCGAAWASSRPMPIRRCGWPWAWRCWSPGVLLKSQVLRIASAVLIAVAVAKVFIFDMSELEGVLRALSFIGLGAVLIGIGLFYQRC